METEICPGRDHVMTGGEARARQLQATEHEGSLVHARS